MWMKCAVANHQLVDGVLVTNPEHINFIRKSVKDFRYRAEICRQCKISMEYMYEKKMRRAKAKLRQSQESVSLESVSAASDRENSKSLSVASDRNSSKSLSVASDRNSSKASELDAIDRLVTKTPLHRPKKVSTAENSQLNGIGPVSDSHKGITTTPQRASLLYSTSNKTLNVVNAGTAQTSIRKIEGIPKRVSFLDTSKHPMVLLPGSRMTLLSTGGRPFRTTEADPLSQNVVPASPLSVSHFNAVASPTIYDDDANTHGIVEKRLKSQNADQLRKGRSEVDEGDVEHFQRTLNSLLSDDLSSDGQAPSNVRLSQEPTTSAAAVAKTSAQQTPAAVPKPSAQQTPVAATKPSAQQPPVLKRITDFLKPIVQKTTTQAKSNKPSVNSKVTSTNVTKVTAPTISADTAGGKRSFAQHHSDTADDVSDDDEPRYSLSYFDGTRLPNVQPHVKRSRQNRNPDVMGHYLADITGG